MPMLVESLERRSLMNGMPDYDFGPLGQRVPDLGFAIVDVAVQADGRLVVAGMLHKGFAVARLLPDGARDRSFGPSGDGIVTANFGGNLSDRPSAVAIAPDGKIVVGGTKTNAFDDWQIAVARLLPNGRLDATLDGDGMVVRDPGSWASSSCNDLAVQPDGKIVIAGVHEPFLSDQDFMVARLMPDGQLDHTFGTSLNGYRLGYATVGFGAFFEGADAMALQRDGKIVVAGHHHFARFNTNGTLDTSFDGDGKMSIPTYNVGFDPRIHTVALQPNGKLLAGGAMGGYFATYRFNGNGSPDESFGSHGRALVPVSGQYATIRTVLAAPDGKVLAVCSATQTEEPLAVLRFTAGGTPDASFGYRGVARFTFNGARATAAAYDGFGRVVIAGDDAMARIFDVIPKVQVSSWDGHAAEQGREAGNVIVTRDRAYGFTTRVYLNRSGTAASRLDYSDTLDRYGAYVDIRPDQMFEIVKLTPVDDAAAESNETATFTLRPRHAYAMGALTSGTVTIVDNDQMIFGTRSLAANQGTRSALNRERFSDREIGSELLL